MLHSTMGEESSLFTLTTPLVFLHNALILVRMLLLIPDFSNFFHSNIYIVKVFNTSSMRVAGIHLTILVLYRHKCNLPLNHPHHVQTPDCPIHCLVCNHWIIGPKAHGPQFKYATIIDLCTASAFGYSIS